MKIRQLSLEEAEFVAHRLAIETMNSDDEPIPPFHTRERGKLESSLATPFQTFDGKPVYRTFYRRAALLFYLVAKNHCFENGNKRMAVTLTSVFCLINRRWLEITNKDLYDIACVVAKSNPKEMDKVLQVLNQLFKEHIVALDKKFYIDRRKYRYRHKIVGIAK